jgi:hypothetical protein
VPPQRDCHGRINALIKMKADLPHCPA